MRTILIAAGAAAMLLAGCAKPGPPPKPQPGSWTMKNELLDVQGPGADQVKAMMGAMITAANGKSFCMTQADADKADPAKILTNANADCKFDRKEVSSAGVHISGTCTRNGQSGKIAVDGTITSTSQDITTTMDTPSPMGGGNMTMKLHEQKQRTGDCKPGDLPMSAPGGAPAM